MYKRQDLDRLEIENGRCRGAKFTNAVFVADANEAVGAHLEGTDFREATFCGAQLATASFAKANLSGADLQGADLHFAILTGASLNGANLQGATLFGANLWEADLDGADFEGVRTDEETVWPDGVLPQAAGVVIDPFGKW